MSSKKIDIEKVEAALKRAARSATSASREARSGKFLVPKTGHSQSTQPETRQSKK